MNRTSQWAAALAAALAYAIALPTFAADGVCAVDRNTDQMLCFLDAPIRTSTDKQVREAALWQGGPRGVKPMGHTARVFCDKVNVPVLELRDRRGVVYARDQPEAKIGRDLASLMCDHNKTKVDKSLDKAKRF